jgi:cyclopropane-fatty-acyl-phospholipid synthase
MRSRIIWGSVYHWRKSPREHSFSYPVLTMAFDVDELPSIDINPRLCAFEKRAVLSVRGDDYLEGEGTLRDKVERVLLQHGCREKPARITLVTSPRYFGYVFNPVSFLACFDATDRVIGLITQVNNTFGDTHVYPLVSEPTSMPAIWRFSKGFFVSPFFNMEGTYEVALESEGETLHIRVDLHHEGEKAFKASLSGVGRPVSRGQLLKTLIKFPLTLLLTMPRIHLQAMKLYFKSRANVYIRPEPSSAYTIRSRQNIIHKARLALLALLRKAREAGW